MMRVLASINVVQAPVRETGSLLPSAEALWFEGSVKKTPLHSFLSFAAGRWSFNLYFFSYDEQAQDSSDIWSGLAFMEHHIFPPCSSELTYIAWPSQHTRASHAPGFLHPQLEMLELPLIYGKARAMHQDVACQRCRVCVCPVLIQEETAHTSRDVIARIGTHLSG